MKTFKEYLYEAREYDPKIEKENFNKSEARHKHVIDGWHVNPSWHAASQAHIRRPDMKADDWKDMHTKVLAHIKDQSVPDGEHIFYSRKKRQGYVAEVNHKNKQIKIITTLDQGVSRAARPDTRKFMVEANEFYGVYEVD